MRFAQAGLALGWGAGTLLAGGMPVEPKVLAPRAVESRQIVPRSITSSVRVDPRTGRLVRNLPVAFRMGSFQPDRVPAVIRDVVEEKAREHGVDPLLVHAVIQQESAYNPFAVSPKGAEGLMQLIPATQRRFGVKNAFDIRQNIDGGVRYLAYLRTLFSDDRHVLAAYNAGEEAVNRYRGVPPYNETMNYVVQVGLRYGQAMRAKAEKAAAPAAPVEKRIQQSYDAEGRLHLTMP
ncbi:MAG: lytic transglycosylase domain-containing protein [Bryobacter sp.]|nr:lytic transglycosylase domain-containing protein [Bryobacter sp.]